MLCNGYEMDNLWTQNNRRTPTIARYVLHMVAYSNEDRSNYVVHSSIPLAPSTSTCTLTNFILDSRLFFQLVTLHLFTARALHRIILVAFPFQPMCPSQTHSAAVHFAQHRVVHVQLVGSSERMTFQSAGMEGATAEPHITARKVSTSCD